MSKEIEQRWLVRDYDAKVILKAPSKEIFQVYFETPPTHSLRVRVVNSTYAELTRKSGLGRVREEEPHVISLSTALFLMKSCPYKIHKRRYELDGWEFDVFEDELFGIV